MARKLIQGAPSPDTELIHVCSEHRAKLVAFNLNGDVDCDDPFWLAYVRSCDFISTAKPATWEGIKAKARAAQAEAIGRDGNENPSATMGAVWAWQLVSDLLALEEPA